MRRVLLTALCCGLCRVAQAQTYSAPGMPLHLQRRLPPASTKALQPFISPRFWKLRDSAYVKAATPFYKYVGSGFKWPNSTFEAGIEGRVVVRLILAPDGTVVHAEIAQRDLKQAAGYIEEEGLDRGIAALEAEALQFMKKLRFESAATSDTISVPLSIKMQ